LIAGILTASRGGGRYLATLVAAMAVGALCSRYGLKLQFAPANDAVVLSVPEMCAVALTAAALILTRPQLWIIERFGVPSRRWLSAVYAAAAVISGPQLVLAAAENAGLPEGTWPHAATSMLFLASLGVLSAPYAGTLQATGLVISLYLTLTATAQLSSSISYWSPVATSSWPEPGPTSFGKIIFSVAVAVAAVLVTVHTLGHSGRTWKRQRNGS
jgi:hypothetical protein